MRALLLAAILPFALCACDRKDSASSGGSSATPGMAKAELESASGSMTKGNLQLAAMEQGVRITGQVTGLQPTSEHGIHIHEKGDCSASDATSAGEHLNPEIAQHGNPTAFTHHLGDMPNIMADANGMAQVDATIATATLGDGGRRDLMGKAVIVHAMRDDYTTQPSGESGARIACGVIR
jgi:superoxide dismutase, Cu-Zn family